MSRNLNSKIEKKEKLVLESPNLFDVFVTPFVAAGKAIKAQTQKILDTLLTMVLIAVNPLNPNIKETLQNHDKRMKKIDESAREAWEYVNAGLSTGDAEVMAMVFAPTMWAGSVALNWTKDAKEGLRDYFKPMIDQKEGDIEKKKWFEDSEKKKKPSESSGSSAGLLASVGLAAAGAAYLSMNEKDQTRLINKLMQLFYGTSPLKESNYTENLLEKNDKNKKNKNIKDDEETEEIISMISKWSNLPENSKNRLQAYESTISAIKSLNERYDYLIKETDLILSSKNFQELKNNIQNIQDEKLKKELNEKIKVLEAEHLQSLQDQNSENGKKLSNALRGTEAIRAAKKEKKEVSIDQVKQIPIDEKKQKEAAEKFIFDAMKPLMQSLQENKEKIKKTYQEVLMGKSKESPGKPLILSKDSLEKLGSALQSAPESKESQNLKNLINIMISAKKKYGIQ